MARKARSAVSPSPPLSSLPAGLVERLKVVSAELGQALTDDFSEVTQFCRTLEAILRHLQKGRGCTGVHECLCDCTCACMCACVRVCTRVGMCVYTTFVCLIFIFAVSVFECAFLCPPSFPPSLPPSSPSLPPSPPSPPTRQGQLLGRAEGLLALPVRGSGRGQVPGRHH